MLRPSRQSVDRRIGLRLRQRRTDLDISAKLLGEAIGVTQQQITKYERGTNRISASRLDEIANQLQVPLSYFFDQP